jgi:hypothetical protein
VPAVYTNSAAERKRLDEIKYSVKVNGVITSAMLFGSGIN